MLNLPVSQVMHRDVIGFDKNGVFVRGQVVAVGTRRLPDNKCRPVEFEISVDTPAGVVTGVFVPSDSVVAFSLDDDQNPARTRNSRSNWASLGISAVEEN